MLHLLDDLGELRVRILPGYRFVLIREQVFDVGGAQSGQPLRRDAGPSRGVLGLSDVAIRASHRSGGLAKASALGQQGHDGVVKHQARSHLG